MQGTWSNFILFPGGYQFINEAWSVLFMRGKMSYSLYGNSHLVIELG
jgi:hypothetical protein